MKELPTTIIVLVLFGQPAFGQELSAEFSARSPDALAAAVKQLSAGRYEIRQQATELLWAAGADAIPVLERATQDKNREVRSRAAYVLENVRQGIEHDLPREVLREVQRFRDGDLDDRRFALNNLENALRPRILLGLLQTERDGRARQEWTQNLERAIQKALLAGAEQHAEVALRDAATDDVGIRHWVAYLASRARLDEELTRLLNDPTLAPPAARATRLAYLYRAKGDLSEARRYGEQVVAIGDGKAEQQRLTPRAGRAAPDRAVPTGSNGEPDLAWQLTLEQRDWPTAARKLKERIDREPQTVGRDPETLGFASAYHRLAGDEAAAERYAQTLCDVADEAERMLPDLDPRREDVEKNLINRQWFAGKALLLNGQYQRGVQVLRRHHASFAFELLVHQQRYREAFELAGVSYPRGFDASWFEKLVAETAKGDDAARQRFAIGMHALRQFHFLGEREQVSQWITLVQRGIANDQGTVRRRMLCDTAVKLGMRDLAVAVGAVVLEREGSPAMLAVLYPHRTSSATVWWEFFREQFGSERVAQSLVRMDRCLLYQGSKFATSERERLLAEVEARIPQLPAAKKAEWWHGLAETWLLHGERELALRFFEKAAALSSVDTLRLGDWYAGEKQWVEAAEWYRQTWEFDKLKPLPLFLYGRMLCNAGRVDEGQQHARIALLLPLGHDEWRRELAAGLKERGYREESAQQFELLSRTGLPGEHDVVEANKQIGNAVYLQDALRGADCWETMVLCCLRTKWGFLDANGYVQIPFLVHKSRAKGLLKIGRIEQAVREVWTANRVAPLNLELAEELIPELQKANCPHEVDQLFRRSSGAMKELCRDFPKCATLHNNLAWLCARVGRDLDEAFEHAQQALQLDPDSPAYVDTLGEVHFQRKEFDQAIACAERCVELDSRSQHYREQLARFRQAKMGGSTVAPAAKPGP